MHHFVDETHLQRAFRAHASAGKNHVERGLQPNAPRKTLCAAQSRNQSELNLRKGEGCLRVIGAHSIPTGERQLDPAAETGPVNRCDDRNAQQLEAAQHPLSHLTDRFSRGGRLERGELLDVGTGDEALRLPGDQHHSLNEWIVLGSTEDVFEFAGQRWTERIDRGVRRVDRDDEDAVFDVRR